MKLTTMITDLRVPYGAFKRYRRAWSCRNCGEVCRQLLCKDCWRMAMMTITATVLLETLVRKLIELL